LNMGNGNMPANLTNAAAFTFDGQGGSDTFNIRNAATTENFTYTVASNSLTTTRNFPSAAYSWFAQEANIEQTSVYAGGGTSIANITNVASGQSFDFHGAAGDDSLNLPPNPNSLAGRINFFGGVSNNL